MLLKPFGVAAAATVAWPTPCFISQFSRVGAGQQKNVAVKTQAKQIKQSVGEKLIIADCTTLRIVTIVRCGLLCGCSCVGGVMRVVSAMSACVLAATLGGCAIFADPNAWPQKFNYADSANLASGANVRYVNDRLRDMPGREGRPLATMCTEPAPDVAVAFGTSLGASANIAGQGSGGFGAGTNETAMQLAGRTAGVLALRDGLYATCQAYANGALGQSAYALGLSQYGNLLVALTAHDPGFQPAATATSVTAAGPSITITPNGNGAPTVKITPSSGALDITPQAQPAVADADDLPPVLPVQAPAQANGATPANPNPGLFAAKDSASHALLVACISEYDPTRLGARNPANGETWHSGVLTEGFCRNYIRRFSTKLMVTAGK